MEIRCAAEREVAIRQTKRTAAAVQQRMPDSLPRGQTRAYTAPARKVSRTECTDPTADQKDQQTMLTEAGCLFTPLTQTGKTYRYSATCKMGGMSTKSDSVLEAESPEAYTITVDSTVDGSKTHEVLRARRIGDCAK
jgi:hypothetical protein